MSPLPLAMRNVLRQKKRTLTTLSALVVGLAGLVVFQGFLVQTMHGFRQTTIQSGIGHLQIAASQAYWDDGEFSAFNHPLEQAGALIDQLSHDPRVEAVFPSTGFTALAGYGGHSTTLLVKAFPENRMLFWPQNGPAPTDEQKRGKFTLGSLIQGKGNVGPDGLILGETSARILGAKIGDVVTLMALLPRGALNAQDFTVRGIYHSAGRDKIYAWTTLNAAQTLLGQNQPPVLHVLAHSITDTNTIAASVGSVVATRTWPKLATFYVQVNNMFIGFLAVIRLLLVLITLFILANALNRIVFERMREWGTLRAFGTKRSQIMGVIVCEGTLLGFLGAATGIAAGLAVSLVINLAGGLPFPNDGNVFWIKVVPTPMTLVSNLVVFGVAGALSSFFPALRATKPSPAEALRSL